MSTLRLHARREVSSLLQACAFAWLWLDVSVAVALDLDAQLPAGLHACVSAQQLQRAYQRALAAYGGEAVRALALQVRVRSAPGTRPDLSLLQLTASSAGLALGTRELAVHTRDCATLPDALGLVLALLSRNRAQPSDQQAQADRPPSAAVTIAPASQQSDASEPLTTAQSVANPQQHIVLGAGVGAIFAVLPSAAAALQLQAATPGERLSVRLKAGMLWPQEQRLAEGVIEARSYELSLELCSGLALPSWPRLVLRACAGPRIGLMFARGREFRVANQDQRELLLYLGALPEAALRLAGQTWLQLGAGAAVALVRPRFQVGLERSSSAVDMVDVVQLSHPGVMRAELSLSMLQIF